MSDVCSFYAHTCLYHFIIIIDGLLKNNSDKAAIVQKA